MANLIMKRVITKNFTYYQLGCPAIKYLLMGSEGGEDCSLKMTDFWDDVACSLVESDQCFRNAYCLHQGATSQKTVIFMLATKRT
jgi:hypothetical protein